MPFYNFRDYFYYLLEENSKINESVINKISKLFLINDAEKITKQFKEIFNINDNIRLKKIDIGGSYEPNINTISYSTMNSLIHELIHYLQHKSKNEYVYITPKFDDCGLLRYIYQPLELNNWALSLAEDAQIYNSFNSFIDSGKYFNNFERLNRDDRIKHIVYLIVNNTSCPESTKNRQKLLKLTKQYYLTIKTLRRNRDEFLINEIHEPFI